MSGICGLISWNGAPVERTALDAMARAASHRGPDGIHLWSGDRAALAHLALHLSPEDASSSQPLAGPPGDLVLTADARLDNRSELISLLAARGLLADPAPSDAALILAAYRLWGEECPAHLLGDFAFALWDGTRRRLFAARDAMGMRALYYREEPHRFLFATELKQILAAPGVPARLFEPAVGAHLAGVFGPLEWTFYEGIAQLAPGHALAVEAGGVRTWRYWDIDPGLRVRYRDEGEYAEAFREAFLEAVRCRVRSVKPVGLMLSGGMDSGSIGATAGWLWEREGGSAPEFRAYSWAFEELAECDERHISGKLARHYGIGVTEVGADEAWPLRGYPAHGPDRDEPFVEVYQALIEKTLGMAAAEGMGVVLSGDRGDLLVGDWIFDYEGLLRSGRWGLLQRELHAYTEGTGAPMRKAIRRHLLQPLQVSLWPSTRAPGLRRAARRMLRRSRPSPALPDWVCPQFARRIGLADIVQQRSPHPPLSSPARCQRYQRIFTPAGVRSIVGFERCQARFGLGFADPWSDRRLASFILAVPQWVVQRVEAPKRIAREAMRGVMPEPVRQAACKTEPGTLFDRGFKEHGRETVLRLIQGSRAGERGFVNVEALRGIYESFLRGEPVRYDFWSPLTLEMWLRQYWS